MDEEEFDYMDYESEDEKEEGCTCYNGCDLCIASNSDFW